MKLLKFILSTILFAVTFVVVLTAEYATLYVLSLPVQDVTQRVELIADEETDVTYADSLGFWGTDFKAATSLEEPKFVIRSWFDWKWWQEGMVWADYAYTYTTEFVTPIVAPMYVAKDMYMYRSRDLFVQKLSEKYTEDPFDVMLGEEDALFTEIEIASDAYYYAGILTAKNNKSFNDNYIYTVTGITARSAGYVNTTSYEWNKDYNDIINIELMISKYNQPVFEKYINKFYDEDGNFKSVAMLLFYQIFLALILAAYFTYQSPVVINRGNNNENEIEGRFLPRVPKLGRVGLGKRHKKDRRA